MKKKSLCVMILHEKGNITMRTLNVDAFYDACLLAFQGVRYKEIGERLNVTPHNNFQLGTTQRLETTPQRTS